MKRVHKMYNRCRTLFHLYIFLYFYLQICLCIISSSFIRMNNFFSKTPRDMLFFLCQLTCQSADIILSLCGMDVCVCVSDFSDETKLKLLIQGHPRIAKVTHIADFKSAYISLIIGPRGLQCETNL